jgi:methenyltetrahydrofolate cyclohydrolase
VTHDDALSAVASSQPIGGWLEALGSRAPAPGGGAAAALMASVGVARLAAQLPGRSNPNVLSDVGVAASAAAAAIDAAAINVEVNVEVNLAALTDQDTKAALARELAGQVAAAEPARRLAAGIREELGG